MTIINRSKRRRHNSLHRFTNETTGLNVNAIDTRRLERNATFSVNQRMILVLILALVALLFLMAAQPEGEASFLPGRA